MSSTARLSHATSVTPSRRSRDHNAAASMKRAAPALCCCWPTGARTPRSACAWTARHRRPRPGRRAISPPSSPAGARATAARTRFAIHRPQFRRSGLAAGTREVHIIADNLSTHKTALVTAFLDAHPNVTLHHTPTYSSWLNQVELWFAQLKRDLLARGVFTSVADLARKLRRFVAKYNERAKPVRWSSANPGRRVT